MKEIEYLELKKDRITIGYLSDLGNEGWVLSGILYGSAYLWRVKEDRFELTFSNVNKIIHDYLGSKINYDDLMKQFKFLLTTNPSSMNENRILRVLVSNLVEKYSISTKEDSSLYGLMEYVKNKY